MSWKTGAKFYRTPDTEMTLWHILTLFVSFLIIGAFILAYYMSLIAFAFLAVNKAFSSYLGGLGSTFLFGCLSTYVLIKAAKESSLSPIAWLTASARFYSAEMKKVF